MIKSSEWLDVVWALTILDQVTPEQLQTVLNTGFIEKLAGMQFNYIIHQLLRDISH